jgi:tetratricopeptide (TPR) repeat protein
MRIAAALAVGVGLALSGTLGGQGRTAVASLKDLEARALADSNDPVVLFDLALGYVRAKKNDDARRALEAAIQVDREFAPAYTVLARLRLIQFAPPMAFRLRQADGRLRVVVLRSDSSMDSTSRLLRRAFLLDPLQDIDPAESNDLPVVWRGTLSLGLRHFRQNQFDRAIAVFDSVIGQADRQRKEVPPVALWYHALSAASIQRFDLAITDMERLLDRAFRDSTMRGDLLGRSVRYVLARLHQRAGHLQEAERLYRQLAEEDLSLDLAHIHLATIYESQQRWSEAVQERRYALAIESDDPTMLYDLGLSLLEAGQTSEAAATLRRVLSLNPRESRAHYVLGIAETRLGNPQAARVAYDRFLQLAPSRYGNMIADARARRERLP